MQRPDPSRDTVSRTFFVSQCAAVSIFGLSAALGDFAAEDFLPAGLTIFAVLSVIAAVIVLRLPGYFASRLSSRSLSFVAILSSLFAVVFSYINAASYFDLPAGLLESSGIRSLRLVAFLGLAAFSLAFLANVIAAAVAVKIRRQVSS